MSTANEKRISFVTLGCAKNEVDTAHMQNKLYDAGFLLEEDPAAADAIIINTCSFIQAATEESLATIFDLAELPSVRESRVPLIVAGCMPARYGEDLKTELSEAQIFIPCDKEADVVRILCDTLKCEPLKTGAADLPERCITPSAYLKISDGCSRCCTYCTIPAIRGPYHSFSLESILEEADKLVACGVKELVLIAQDTGLWGKDLPQASSLAFLLESLATRHPDVWLRVLYLQPEGITDDLLKTMARYDNICSYFDIPLQHVDADILRAMNRRGSFEETKSLVAHIKKTLPDATLRTTLIAGFPGEDEEAFGLLCDFVEEDLFDYVGVFPYSQEEGTRAAELSDQLEEDEKLVRAQTIRDVADALGTARVAQRQGSIYDVLVLGREEDGQLFGRAQCQAPEVDGVTYLNEGVEGEVRKVRIVDTLLYEMEGE